MKYKIVIAGAFAALILMSACSKGEDKKPTVMPPVKVVTMRAQPTEITASRVYSGTIEESSATPISFAVSGTVKTINVSAGNRVVKGQLIATLDQSTLRNAYDIAKSALDQAQDAYDRMKQLHDSNSLPDMQWVEVQNVLKQAQSSEAIAAKALRDAELYAPVSGYVSQKYIEPGMTVAPIEPVIKIVTINPVKATMSIPENEISSIALGQRANVTVGAAGEARFEGKVSEKGVAANPLSRAYDVRIRIDNPDGIILPGMICDITLDNAMPHQAMVLPLDAVLLDASNQNFVWIKADGHAAKRIVKVESLTDDGIVISTGINPGDSVIVSGQQKVSQNTPVIDTTVH